MASTARRRALLHALVPDVAASWAASWAVSDLTGESAPIHRRIDGTLAFIDVSGFTRLTERLARHGHVGSEELSDLLDETFGALLGVAHHEGGDLVKWGGDAVLLLFDGPDHALRATRAAFDMRSALRGLGALRSSAGAVRLRMSVGVHTAPVDLFLVGDPEVHRELVVAGPATTRTAELESAASAGEILLSATTAAQLAERHLRPGPLAGSSLLRSRPSGSAPAPPARGAASVDLAVLVPTAVRRHVVTESGDAAEAEHRSVAVAFLRFGGTDDLLDEQGPDALAAALDASIRAVQESTEAHGVTFLESDLDKNGVKVMLVSGAPLSHGHDEERMLRTVRAIVESKPPLPLQVGVNRGHVFTGGFGPAFRRTYSVKGDAVNLAARLAARAEPGEVLVTPEVLTRSETSFDTEALEPFLVKGKAHPVRASRVGAASGRRGLANASTPFVGRERETAQLRAALDAAAEGRGQLLDVVGEPGIGKSRLVAESLASRPDVRMVRGTCDEYDASTPYFPLRQLLRDAMGLPPDVPEQFVRAQLIAVVEARAPHLLPWLPLLAIPLDVTVPATAEATDLDEQFRKGRLERAVTELLELLLPGPTVLLVEDSHLMDDASGDLLEHLARRISTRPWLLVITRREFPRGYVPSQGPHVLSLMLAPLTAAARGELVRAATDAHPLSREAMAALTARSGGNPMFLEALLNDVARGGTGDLPETVESLVTAQVDRLGPLDRTVLRYAAVLGLTVDRPVLESLLAEHLDGIALADRLPRLADFLVEDGTRRFRFRHAIMREVAYEGLPYRRRAPLHADVAAMLERGSRSPEAQAEILSFHFSAAGDHDKAWRYSVLAGERARAKYANAEAVDFYERAVAAARHGAAVADQDVAAAYEKLGDACFLLGSVADATDAFNRARRLLRGDPVHVAAVVVNLARIDQRQRQFDRSLRRISRSLTALRDDPSREAASARAYLADRYAVSRFSQGRVGDALRWGAFAARSAEDAADKSALAQAYAVMNAICVASGREEELPYGRLALQAYAELGELTGQAHCLNNLAVRALAGGRWIDALADFRRAAEIFDRVGDTASAGSAVFNQAEVLVRQGVLDDAQQLLDEARRVALLVEDEELQALVARETGRVLARSGQFDQAEHQLAEADALFTALGQEDELVDVAVCRAEAALLHGDSTGALGLVTELRRAGVPPRPDLCRIAGFAHLRAGHRTEADAELVAGLAAVEGPEQDYERGLLLLGRSQVALLGAVAGGQLEETDDGAALLRRLGVVSTPFSVVTDEPSRITGT
jgi:class 3 adenylate cyclase/tetratricopeptide (TPR) repeat protein